MRIFIYILISLLILIFSSNNLWAQELFKDKSSVFDSRSVRRVWRDNVGELRKSTNFLLEQNDSLNDENKSLNQEILNIKKDIEKIKEENIKLRGEPPRLNKLIKEEESKSTAFLKELNRLERHIATLRKAKAPLENELLKIEAKQRPWEKQVLELNSQKAGLVLDLRQIEALKEKEIGRNNLEIKKINEQLSSYEEELKKIRGTIGENSNNYSQILVDIEQLQKENKEMSLQISKDKKSLVIDGKEIKTLEDKNEGIQKTINSNIPKKSAEKEKWQSQVNQLQDRVEEVQISLGPIDHDVTEKEKSLLVNIEGIETEKEGLEVKINDLNDALAILERENAMIEDMLDQKKQAQGVQVIEEDFLGRAESEFDNISEAMGYAFAAQGMYSKAIEKYEEALKEGADKKNVYFNLGYVYYEMGDLRYAIHYYKKVLGIDPNDQEARGNLNKLREELKDSKR